MTKLSLFSGAHLALIRKRERVCLLPRGCHCSQPGWSIAASALSGEVELYVILEVTSCRESGTGIQAAAVQDLAGRKQW